MTTLHPLNRSSDSEIRVHAEEAGKEVEVAHLRGQLTTSKGNLCCTRASATVVVDDIDGTIILSKSSMWSKWSQCSFNFDNVCLVILIVVCKEITSGVGQTDRPTDSQRR